jgi:hypothetical protein
MSLAFEMICVTSVAVSVFFVAGRDHFRQELQGPVSPHLDRRQGCLGHLKLLFVATDPLQHPESGSAKVMRLPMTLSIVFISMMFVLLWFG